MAAEDFAGVIDHWAVSAFSNRYTFVFGGDGIVSSQDPFWVIGCDFGMDQNISKVLGSSMSKDGLFRESVASSSGLS